MGLGTHWVPIRDFTSSPCTSFLGSVDPTRLGLLVAPVNVTDAVTLLSFIFRDGNVPDCRKAADADDNGSVSVTDAIRILLHLFGGGGPLPAPFSSCGVDPSPDELPCESFRACEG